MEAQCSMMSIIVNMNQQQENNFYNQRSDTMKRLVILAAIIASTSAFADQYVNGYTRSDGTYVAPHMRSDTNSIRSDNYNSQGNSNPYTGQQGHERNEYSTPPQYNNSYNNGQGRQLNQIYGNPR